MMDNFKFKTHIITGLMNFTPSDDLQALDEELFQPALGAGISLGLDSWMSMNRQNMLKYESHMFGPDLNNIKIIIAIK